MAELITATDPDGREVEVSRKAFDLIYRGRGYTEGTATRATETYADRGDVTSTRPKRRRKSTLTEDVVANGPSDDAK